jgi:hypothetical protein
MDMPKFVKITEEMARQNESTIGQETLNMIGYLEELELNDMEMRTLFSYEESTKE